MRRVEREEDCKRWITELLTLLPLHPTHARYAFGHGGTWTDAEEGGRMQGEGRKRKDGYGQMKKKIELTIRQTSGEGECWLVRGRKNAQMQKN